MLNTPLSPWPQFDDEELQAVADVLRSGRVNYWTGDTGRSFEREFAHFADCTHAVALANGTLALDLALQGLQIGPGDEVIVTPRTFIASVSSVVNAGATPVFADVDPDSGNITEHTITAVLTERTRAVIPVHLAGWPCRMLSIMELAQQNSLQVVEDCAQAHGARIQGRSVGSFGAVGAWSFCQDKIITTGGEGGMVTCQDEALWQRMWSFKDHGKSYAAVYQRSHPKGFRWLHDSFGTNWRMLEMQAAIGRIQLARMAQWHARRAAIAQAYAKALSPYAAAVRVPLPEQGVAHAFYRFYCYVRPEGLRTGWSRDRIIEELTVRGVPAYQGSCSEVYLEKAFDGTGLRPPHRLPVAAELGDTSLMLLTHPTIGEEELQRVLSTLGSVFDEAAR